MPSEKEFQELAARVARIEAIPRIQAQLKPGSWPRVVGFGEGTVSSGEQDKLAFERAHPKSKELVRAEMIEAEAKAAFDQAQDAWLRASQLEPGGQYLSADAQGHNAMVVDVPADTLIQGRLDIPEYGARVDAERALISARVRMFGLQKRREREMIEWERRKNPPKNPSKGDSQSWPQRIRMASFGGR